MATRFGNFKDLSQGKEPITDEEALALVRALGTMIPGGSSIYALAEGKGPREALMELQDWIPGNAAYQNWLNGRKQDWGRNVIDLATVGIPLARPAGKALKKGAEFVERIPKGGKEGFINYKRIPNTERTNKLSDDFHEMLLLDNGNNGVVANRATLTNRTAETMRGEGVYRKPRNWETLGTEERARLIAKNLANDKLGTWDHTFPAHNGKLYMQESPEFLDAYDYAEFSNYLEHHPKLGVELMTGQYGPETKSFITGNAPEYSEEPMTFFNGLASHAESMIGDEAGNALVKYPSAAEIQAAKKADKVVDEAKLAKQAAKQAEKEAKWKAEREAAQRAAEEKRLAKEAEQKRLAEEAERQRLAEEAEERRIAEEAARKQAEEEEFERQFREEQNYENNRYADSVATAAAQEAVDKDIFDWQLAKEAEKEAANKVAAMDEFTGDSYNLRTPSSDVSSSTGRTRNTYDHSREFNGGTFQKLPPIDRSRLLKSDISAEDVGERLFDAQSRFYNPYSEMIAGLDINGRNIRTKYPKSPVLDPYNEAGVINDENFKLNKLIDDMRRQGYSDQQIYDMNKDAFDKYQGMLDRYKARIQSPESNMIYDGASTNYIRATPSEEINALRSLGLNSDVDPRMGDIMDKTRNHYADLVKRMYDYESRFPPQPKLSTETLVKLKNLGVPPEEIDIYLAEHPELLR